MICCPSRQKSPSEIFGYPLESEIEDAIEARKLYLCPFDGNNVCSKQSRLLKYPMGVCSVWYPPYNNPIGICPKRFLQDKTIFIESANLVFGDTNNILLFQEVGFRKFGNFDFVLVKHKPISDEIEDFCVVEFQTCSTTSTGKLVNSIRDFMNNEDVTNLN